MNLVVLVGDARAFIDVVFVYWLVVGGTKMKVAIGDLCALSCQCQRQPAVFNAKDVLLLILDLVV